MSWCRDIWVQLVEEKYAELSSMIITSWLSQCIHDELQFVLLLLFMFTECVTTSRPPGGAGSPQCSCTDLKTWWTEVGSERAQVSTGRTKSLCSHDGNSLQLVVSWLPWRSAESHTQIHSLNLFRAKQTLKKVCHAETRNHKKTLKCDDDSFRFIFCFHVAFAFYYIILSWLTFTVKKHLCFVFFQTGVNDHSLKI